MAYRDGAKASTPDAFAGKGMQRRIRRALEPSARRSGIGRPKPGSPEAPQLPTKRRLHSCVRSVSVKTAQTAIPIPGARRRAVQTAQGERETVRYPFLRGQVIHSVGVVEL